MTSSTAPVAADVDLPRRGDLDTSYLGKQYFCDFCTRLAFLWSTFYPYLIGLEGNCNVAMGKPARSNISIVNQRDLESPIAVKKKGVCRDLVTSSHPRVQLQL
jgi:hypothetical protein